RQLPITHSVVSSLRLATGRQRRRVEEQRVSATPSTFRAETPLSEGIEVTFGIERCHAAEPGGCDCLTVYVVRNVARREYTRHTGHRRVAVESGSDTNVTTGHVELALEDAGIRRVTNRDEDAGQWNLTHSPVVVGREPHGGNATGRAEYF